jgi:hypothetical protein
MNETNDKRLREALSTFVTERLIPRIVPEISAPEAFRLKKLIGSLMVAIAPYSDPWVAMEIAIRDLDGESQLLDILVLKNIVDNASEVRSTTYHLRIVGKAHVRFKWTESKLEGIWACNIAGYGTARIHPEKGEWAWKLIVNLDKGSGHLDTSVDNNDLEKLMTHFEDEAIRSGTTFHTGG